ncbi:cobyrinic acid a,c-diamide synthase [Pseudooceanicola nitratireducens]|jgi:cobyrinic acid a,c-diamide synthase|uniref:Hydrogenobyrinate a,c-diamide synthase n=1 Tax=Pseudooceanicola nitratireducens TaxID=517719 RepID=A0A1I1L9C3_9RHOB|nr:cobyrinate a,c-diamide synthase [Pseudooceanicola nitratireducens]SEJ41787.1 cobyrinic acid a,c-diamide synthase [Pseudooceanicola nitratireducens]SFC66140.1 cobyrinic acid a,c-diamide synthase [Pseudooceanicola nitratireducens]
MAAGRGVILAAPSSGAGKTTVTLALLRLLAQRGVAVRGAKSGPDYIDPKFHEAACGRVCLNLDAWAMTRARVAALAGAGGEAGADEGLLVIEGAMGLFDGAPPDGRGAVADLARDLALPVVLVVDAGRMAQSVAPLVAGFAGHDPGVRVAGVILNKVGSARHAGMLRRALEPLGLPVLGALPRRADLAMPSRHLGLVQAGERADLEDFLDRAAEALEGGVPGDRPFDLEALVELATGLPQAGDAPGMEPPAQRIAVAQDQAFAFAYPHLLRDWRARGAEITLFSPLMDDPVPQADFVYLPGGYPELHAGRIAASEVFLTSLRAHAETRPVYGECGGYMVLGEGLVDAEGTRHRMAGLLGLETSFQTRRMHLGYRRLRAGQGPMQGDWAGHEFHYATTLKAEGEALFQAWDAEGTRLEDMGLRRGHVAGSFAHVIDRG